MSKFFSFTQILVLSAACCLLPIAAEVDGDEVVVPEFSLIDVNSTSPTFEQQISPRDYLQQVSGWFFGHSS